MVRPVDGHYSIWRDPAKKGLKFGMEWREESKERVREVSERRVWGKRVRRKVRGRVRGE